MLPDTHVILCIGQFLPQPIYMLSEVSTHCRYAQMEAGLVDRFNETKQADNKFIPSLTWDAFQRTFISYLHIDGSEVTVRYLFKNEQVLVKRHVRSNHNPWPLNEAYLLSLIVPFHPPHPIFSLSTFAWTAMYKQHETLQHIYVLWPQQKGPIFCRRYLTMHLLNSLLLYWLTFHLCIFLIYQQLGAE